MGPATYNVPFLRSILVTAVAVAKGTRLSFNGTAYAAAAVGVRGDMIAIDDIPASGRGLCAPINGGGSVPVIAGEASCDAGDPAYSMAAGLTGVTSGGGQVIMGTWIDTTASGTLGRIELKAIL